MAPAAGGGGEGGVLVDLVQVSLSADGSVLFTCRVCQEHCPAPEGVPLDQATRDFLAMHPACADQAEHDEGCPDDSAASA